MTKAQLRSFADRYLQKVKQHTGEGIFAAYKRPSQQKIRAYYSIRNEVSRMLPWHTPVIVMEHSCQTFSVAYCYIVAVNDVDTATFVYRTAKNTYTMRLEPEEVETVESLCV